MASTIGKIRKKRYEKVINNVLFEGMSQKDAYQAVYKQCNDASAGQQASRLLARNDVKELVAAILEKNTECSLPKVIKHIGRDLTAKKDVIYNNKGDKTAVRDNVARSAAQDKLLRLHGVPGFIREGTHIDNRQVNQYNIGKEDLGGLGTLVSDLKKLSQSLTVSDGEQSGELPESKVIDV